MSRRHNSGCGSVLGVAPLVALVPASFATPGMWWVGAIIIVVFALALLGALGNRSQRRAARVRPVSRPPLRSVPARIFYRSRCLHCGAPRSHNAAVCRYCGTSLVA